MPAPEMDEEFDLPVEYQGREILFPAQLVRRGYGYKIHVMVDGQEIVFEPDEERNFRAVQMDESGKKISLDVLRAIVDSLEKNLR